MNETQVILTAVTDRRGAPATRLSMQADERYAVYVPPVTALAAVSPVMHEWLDLFAHAIEQHDTVASLLQKRMKQAFPENSWPNRPSVDGWYEIVVGAPLLICTQQTAEQVWHYAADKGWMSDQAGRYHWPEANGQLSTGKFIELFRTDPVLRTLPIRFAVELRGGPVADAIQLCKDLPIAALLDPLVADATAADQLRRELKGQRLSVGVYETANWISPTLTGPAGMVEKAAETFRNGVAPVLLDDPFLPWGMTAAVARGVYAEGLIAGSPVTQWQINPYTTNAEL